MSFLLVLYEKMHYKHNDIPILADLGEPGTPFIGEVERPKRKRLDVIHGADIHQPADRNPKYSLPERKSAAQRRALCTRLCANTGEYLSMKNDGIGDENREPTSLMRYSELRTQYPLGSYATSENLTTGFDYDGQTTDL